MKTGLVVVCASLLISQVTPSKDSKDWPFRNWKSTLELTCDTGQDKAEIKQITCKFPCDGALFAFEVICGPGERSKSPTLPFQTGSTMGIIGGMFGPGGRRRRQAESGSGSLSGSVEAGHTVIVSPPGGPGAEGVNGGGPVENGEGKKEICEFPHRICSVGLTESLCKEKCEDRFEVKDNKLIVYRPCKGLFTVVLCKGWEDYK